MLKRLLSVVVLSSVAASADCAELRCRVVDRNTGNAIPCRVYLQGENDEWHFARSLDSDGSAVNYDVSRSPTSYEKHTTVSAHPFAFTVPPGQYVLAVERGKEYRTAQATINVDADVVEHEVQLERWIDMAARGWYSGDTHVHRSIAELPNVMLAEDLNVALPLSYWVRDAYTPPSQGDKSTEVEAGLITVDPTHVIWPMNTEYELFTVNGQRHTLGAVFVLNHQRPLTPAAPPVGPVAAEARSQNAILDLDKHSWPWSMMLIPVMDVDLYELSNNHIWRTNFFFNKWTFDQLPAAWNIETDADGFTEWGWTDFGFKAYYALLNCGFRMRPTAGTASGVHPVPLGYGRVYVHLPDGFSYDAWMSGLNAGRSFVTTGPMLLAEFDGQAPGGSRTAALSTTMRVNGTVESDRPIKRIEIIVNGDVVKTLPGPEAPQSVGHWAAEFDETIHLEQSSWVAVRCFDGSTAKQRFAHTAPVHVDIAGQPLRPRKHETAFLVGRMEAELERNRDVLAAEELAEYEAALKVYRELDAVAVE